jgi:uncharacterized membrane protein YhaH (DUF805 family)
MNEFLSRFAKPGTLTLALIVVALAFAFVYEHSFFGTLQYVTAFAFYLAVMASVAPIPALLRRRGHFGLSHWLALAAAAIYAGNGIYVGRVDTVLLLAVGGVVVGLLIGLVMVRNQEVVPQA